MESEQTENFNERLNQWVSNQGFWFQIRYSMSGSGSGGRAMFHLLRMAARLLVFVLILAVGAWIYLMKRPDTPQFFNQVRVDMQAGLAATELEVIGVQHSQGQLDIGRLAAQGGEDTFFDSIEGRNIRFNMNLLNGLVGIWDTGNIDIARLEVDLRAGTNDPQSAAKLAETIFRKPIAVEVNSFDVADATLRWGYTKLTQSAILQHTRGAIVSSHLKMQRVGTGWRLSFSGGTFSQNWLRDLEIVNLVVIADREGLVFERAELKSGMGTVEFPGLRLVGGERPEVDGIVKIRNLALERIVPPALNNFLTGSISGDFKVFGSTNSSDGIGFEGQVTLDGTDVISLLRKRIYLLEALSVVDYSRNYHRVDFREGSFMLKTQRGGMQLTEIDLKTEPSDDLVTLQGEFAVRLPTQQEIDEALAKGSDSSPLFANQEEPADLLKPASSDTDLTLRKAGQEARRILEGKQAPESLTLFDRLGASIEMRRMQSQAAERMSRMLRYDGALRITLPGDAFERAPRLQELHPADPLTGRVALQVPLQGHIFELTLRQAEDIYQQGQR
jgi:hypothetical protein